MKSFIDLMANDVWSPHDIKSRLHAELRGVISDFAEIELKRAMLAESKGIHTLTAEENAVLMLFAQTEAKVSLLGAQARSDMELLNEVLTLEGAQQRLLKPATEATVRPVPNTLPAVEGEVPPELDYEISNQAALDVDTAERFAAQAIVSAASAEALALAELRKPPVQAGPELEMPMVTVEAAQ